MKIPTIQLYKKKYKSIQYNLKYKIEPITCINDSHRKSHSVRNKVGD